MIHGVVSVNQPITESDDLRGMGNFLEDFFISEGKPITGLANDLELALHRRPPHRICLIGWKINPSSEAVELLQRLTDIRQELACLILHKRPA